MFERSARRIGIHLCLTWLVVSAPLLLRAQEGMVGVEHLPEMSTHWKATRPIGNGAGPVTAAALRASGSSRGSWLQYHGDYRGLRHSPLESLDRNSVRDLQVVWTLPTGTTGQFEVSPVIYDGVMYVTTSYNRLFALDAASGEILWRYDHQQPDDLRLCCGPPNRGVAISGDRVFMATLDAKLLAFDRKTGAIDWQTEMIDYALGYSSTGAPLVVGDRVFIGVGGGEFGIRGFFDAYSTETGERLWRHYTVPARGEPGSETWSGTSYEHGGAPTWSTGVYDVDTNTLFWTTGNPSPDWNGDDRLGDNLFSDSLLAVDPDTGERKWHFQFTPHDLWDYDGNSHLFLVDLMLDGNPVKAIVQPNRNGYLYVLDRTNGEFLRATPYLDQVNWAVIDENGRPRVDPGKVPQDEPSERICPGTLGGLNGAWTAAYNPDLGLAFVPSAEACIKFTKGIGIYAPGIPYLGGTPITVDIDSGEAWAHIVAIELATGERRWSYRVPTMGGTLSTAGGVVLTGTLEGEALALDAKTGERLWSFRMGAGVRSQPVAWEQDGRTYVAIGAGNLGGTNRWAGGPEIASDGGVLVVFALPEAGTKP
jgi:alcohol dehydrogenase (cytochrome c)